MTEPKPTVVRLESKEGEKARLEAQKEVNERGARLLRTRKRLKDYLAN